METNIEHGPLLEQGMVTAGLDYYKLTMSQFIYEHEPEVEGTFTFKNRGEQRLLDHVDINELSTHLDVIRTLGFGESELDFMRNLQNQNGKRMFSDNYLQRIAESPLPEVHIYEVDDDLAIDCRGDWDLVTFWETIVMSEVNEMYFENYVRSQGIDLGKLYEEGDRRLSEKIAYLQANPEIKILEFGTRRRFSLRWQKHVFERMREECPENLIGTSNTALAITHNENIKGTFAHELPMGWAALADARGDDIRSSHGKMLDGWYDFYGDELAIALSDTFGSDFFFEDFNLERSTKYRGTRQDSGDPTEYAEKTIAHYEDLEIDPCQKDLLFSDGLNPKKAGDLHDAWGDQIRDAYGIGTNITNDLGVKALNVVMKLTHIRDKETDQEADTVKLSDDPGKHTGPAEKIKEYQDVFTRTELRV